VGAQEYGFPCELSHDVPDRDVGHLVYWVQPLSLSPPRISVFIPPLLCLPPASSPSPQRDGRGIGREQGHGKGRLGGVDWEWEGHERARLIRGAAYPHRTARPILFAYPLRIPSYPLRLPSSPTLFCPILHSTVLRALMLHPCVRIRKTCVCVCVCVCVAKRECRQCAAKCERCAEGTEVCMYQGTRGVMYEGIRGVRSTWGIASRRKERTAAMPRPDDALTANTFFTML